MNLLKRLRQDECGVILSAEIVIVGSLLVVGLITGLTCLQQAVDGELRDVAQAFGALDQSYSFSSHFKPGVNGRCCAFTAGSSYLNCELQTDDCCRSTIVGSGCCEQATGCCGQAGVVSASGCGSCGAHGGYGCGGCGTAGCSSCGGRTGARCIQSGVPKMKITEWPSSSGHALLPISDSYPDGGVVLPGSGSVAPCCPDVSPPHSGDIRIPDHVW